MKKLGMAFLCCLFVVIIGHKISSDSSSDGAHISRNLIDSSSQKDPNTSNAKDRELKLWIHDNTAMVVDRSFGKFSDAMISSRYFPGCRWIWPDFEYTTRKSRKKKKIKRSTTTTAAEKIAATAGRLSVANNDTRSKISG